MRVKVLKSNKVMEVNDSYGTRLIEQGKAILDRQKKETEEREPAKDQTDAGGNKKNSTKKTGKGD